MAREAYRFGFQGCSCIHPNQVAPFNRGFSPTEEEVARARTLVAAYEAKTDSAGAVGIDGEMADGPVIGRARKVVADHEKRLRADGRLAAVS
jgi:citrate lyase beta subunit